MGKKKNGKKWYYPFLLGITVSMALWGKEETIDFFFDGNDIGIIEHIVADDYFDYYTIEIVNGDKLELVTSRIRSISKGQSYPRLGFRIGERIIIAGGNSAYWAAPSYVVGTEYVYTPEYLDGKNNVIVIFDALRRWRR